MYLFFKYIHVRLMFSASIFMIAKLIKSVNGNDGTCAVDISAVALFEFRIHPTCLATFWVIYHR